MKIKTWNIQRLWRLGNVNGIEPTKHPLSQGLLQLSAGAFLKKRLKSFVLERLNHKEKCKEFLYTPQGACSQEVVHRGSPS